jgi:erythronate-4-phosphate dehydrogenase
MTTMNIILDANIPLLPDILRSAGCIVHTVSGRTIDRTVLHDSSALFIRSVTRIAQDIVEGTPLRFIATATSGIEHLDTGYLDKHGIRWASAKGCNAQAVAEYVVYAVVQWLLTTQKSMQEQCVGVIGYGECGRRVVRLLCALGIKRIIVYDPPQQDAHTVLPANVVFASLAELFACSTIVTNHIPLSGQTRHLVSAEYINLMPQGSLMIHASRGGIVDEETLASAVYRGKISAVVDVWQNEPHIHTLLADHALLATPHIAGYTVEGKLRGTLMVLQSFIAWIESEPAHHRTMLSRSALYKAVQEIQNHPLLAIKQTITEHCSNKSIYSILSLLQSARPLLDDTALLRSWKDLEAEHRGHLFDARRAHYPHSTEVFHDEG